MAELILPLGRVGLRDWPCVGTKAARLGEAARAGLPVPAGHCVTVAAFRAQLEQDGLGDRIRARLRPPIDAAAAAEVECWIVAAELEAELRAAVARAFAELGAPVAIRSSAPAEDLPGLSFAGQYASFLQAETLEDVLRDLRACWASAYSARVLAYRAARGLDAEDVAMACLIQSMVPARWAGVAFSADPRTGERDTTVVSAVPGLGETLVSGRRSAAEYVVSGAAPAEPPWLRLVLDLARRAERLFAAPQDVEWAVTDAGVHLLQARPITALPPEPVPLARAERPLLVFPDRVREMLPGAVSPLGLDVALKVIMPCVGEALVHHGLVRGGAFRAMDAPRVLFSRVYLNPESAAAALAPGMDPLELADLFERGAVPPLWRLRPALLLGLLLRAPLMLPRVLWALAHLEALGRRMESELGRLMEPLEALDIAALSDAELMELLRLERPGLRQALIELPPANALARGLVAPTLGALRGLVDRAGESPDAAARLLGGLTGLIEVECAAALWDLARAARGTPVETALERPETALQALRIDPRAADWLVAWDAFIARFGHRATGEADVARPRWREDPAYPLAVVANYLRCPPERAPLAVQEARRAERLALTATLRMRLGPLSRVAFDFVLRVAQAASVVSENTKYHIVRVLDLMRRAALVRGERLVAAGRLGAPADAFFLTLDELASADGAHAARVRQRRSRFAADDALRAPAFADARGRPIRERLPRPASALEPGMLCGLAVSPGVARGHVRRVHDAARGARLDPGEVLVAPFTDPAWTPLFLSAAAVVVEVGSLLSHASIVARELGLPCVVEVAGALDRLRDGELVEVDGSRGTVRRLGD